jgi:glycosyltransferase involved in cell wall biosynthesis
MRVVNLSTECGPLGGGAFRASYKIHRALRAQGIESSVLTLSSSSEDPDMHVVGQATPVDRLRRAIGQKVEALVSRYASPAPGYLWTSGLVGPLQIEKHPDVASADAIILYWVCDGFLSTARIGKLLDLGKPVVWRLSDMWAFTGGCHYSAGCERYRERCGRCPQLRSSREMDLSRLGWEKKHSAWRTSDLTVVCPSTWLANCVRQSSLLGGVDVRVIHTGIDISLFRPFDRRAAREFLGLPLDAHIVLAGASGMSYSAGRKGTSHLVDVISLARSRIPDLHIVVFGTSRKPEGIPGTALGIIRDERLLALVYSAADLFISTSLEDNLPNTVLEALACGLPIVAFGIEGVLDAIRDGDTGLLSPPADIEALASQIELCLLDDERRQVMGRNARDDAVARFDANRQGTEYAALLEERCGKSNDR